ncbi:hypothetical protein RhiJN_05746 [Ceratobasidium sp. AG-Ba]|nr:hypothetical protein RhiJN_05746 [Ceratobasidium sp. AG-Ba]QRW06676.1 hypothetical protein RhiLY_05675 [Ceratobasidium sp. AG-Ba]
MEPQNAATDTDKDWFEDILRRMLSQTRSNSTKPTKTTADEETKATQAARDIRGLARMAMQMTICALDAADEKQNQAEKLFRKRLDAEEKQRKLQGMVERQRLAQQERQKELERARQAEVEEMRRAMEWLQWEEKNQARIREEHKREARRKQEDAERRVADKAAAESLKRAHAETKKYREAAERAEREAEAARNRAERAEEAQRKQAAKAKSEQASTAQQNESNAWSQYTNKWALFKRFSDVASSNPGGVFRFEDIPWPMLSTPSSPEMITKDEVAAFLYSSFSNQGNTMKTRIRDCLLTWHPDKFSGRWMHFVLETDRARVTEAVLAVTRAGNDLMTEYASRRKST